MIINLDESLGETWLNSTGSATNCLRDIENRIASTGNCYIKYDLYEPSYEQTFGYEMRLGVHNENEEANYYRYTGMFFFEDSFNKLLHNAEEIKITFYLMNREDSFIGTSKDDSKDIFNNNILIKGHCFNNYIELVNNWDQYYDDIKHNKGCPYMISMYEELKQAIENNQYSFTITLNNAIIKDFEEHNIKGFQIYCHDTMNGTWSLDRNCLVEITRYKDYYNNTIVSDNAVVVKNNKVYDEKYFHIGNLNFHKFYFFNDEFESLLDKAEELEITFNLLWFLPSNEGNSALNINNNYLSNNERQGCVQMAGHCFKNLEELQLFNTKQEIFEEDANLALLAYQEIKKAIDEGRTSFSFKLNRVNIDTFKEQGIKGIRLGLINNGIGYIRTSDYCEVKIIKYRDDVHLIYDYNSVDNWISLESATLIGKNDSNEVEHAAFYFFDDALYNAIHDRIIENITVRLYYENNEHVDSVDGATYYMCCHNFDELDNITDNYMPRKNTLCSFKIKDDSSGYRDIILSRTQINLLREAKGLCFYSKDKTNLTMFKDFISVYISYYNREDGYTQTRSFNPISVSTFIKDTDTIYENCIVGTTPDSQLYQPYAFLGDNFYSFINSLNNNDIISVKILIIADNIRRIDNIYSSSNTVNLGLYTHSIPYLQDNYNTYKYSDLIFNTNISSSNYVEIELNTAQINILKKACGLGAMINNNVNNDFIIIKEFKVSITYVS